MTSEAETPVGRRKVFYIPGYDPMPPRRYRELYRTESARQAEISGYEIGVFPGETGPKGGWRVASLIDGQVTEAEIEVLTWSDIVQSSMAQGIPATYGQLARTAWTYISTGALRRLMWLRKGPVIAALYPVAMLLAQLGVAVLAAWLVARTISGLTWPGVGWIAGLPLGVWLMQRFRAWDNRIYAYYLMHDYAFSARHRGADPPELGARIGVFADRIAEALGSGTGEVLVVGHSSGAQIAVSALARVLRDGRVPEGGPALSLLTLGQVIPMVSFLPEARQLRADLALLSTSQALTWLDVSAPGDGCAFALCDPVAVSGVAPEGQRWPLVISAAFTQTLAPETWKRLRWRFFRLHFQYLCAFDRPGDYDYFQITAGPVPLARRYAGRAPSQSRIDVAASGYRSMVR